MDPKKSPPSKLFYSKQTPAPSSIKSLDFRQSLSINSVKSLTSQFNSKMGHFFSPKASLEFKSPLFQQAESSLPKKKPEQVSPQLYFISKQKIAKPEETKGFKGVLSEIYNKDTFGEEKKGSFLEKRPESGEKAIVTNNENSTVEKTLGAGRVDLFYRGQVLKILVETPEEKTFSWLKSRMLNEVIRCETEKGNKVDLSTIPINGFASRDGFFLIDFALHSISDWSLGFLKNKRISLVSLIREARLEVGLTSRQSLKQYELLKVIGSGGFSQVILGRKKDTRRMYALKIIRRDFIHKNEKESIIMNEINILKSCDNPFIVHLESAFKTRKYLIFVMDFCAGGEFFCLLKRKKRIKEDEARLYFIELCLGIDYLHRRNIIYRDIKPENILLDLDGHLKIADFGLAKPHMEESMLAYSFCGSPEYMAPEMLRKNGHNFCVDLYCLGTFLYELVVGIPPFYSTNTKEMFQCILKKNILIPDTINLSPEIKNLLRALLEKTPEKRLGYRMGVAEIFQHPWCRKANIEAIAQKRLEPPFKPDLFEFYFDEVSNQDLLEEVSSDFDDNITEILDEEDYNDQLNEFHYVYIEPKTTKNRPASGMPLDNNSNLRSNQLTTVSSSTVLKTQPNEYKSVSSANFEEFLLGMKKSNESGSTVNKLGIESLKKQISVNLGFNKLAERKPAENVHSATVLLHQGGHMHSHNNVSNNVRKSMAPENNPNIHSSYGDFKAKNQPLSTKNVTAKHFQFEARGEGARTFESLEEMQNRGAQQKSQGILAAKTENSLKKNNKLFQEIDATINRQQLLVKNLKFQKSNNNGNVEERIPKGGFNHVSSSQNLHETLARLNAKKTEQKILLDLKRKTMSGSKPHNQNQH